MIGKGAKKRSYLTLCDFTQRESRQKEAMGLKACMGLKAAIYFRCGFRNVREREI
jgi:hypothetical protein